MRRKFIFGALLFIVLLAACVRLYNLAGAPPSPFLDEVSNGYNSYSLLMTGNDEYGKHLPLLMQAYNDYRPTLFVYLMMPFIKVLGLTVFAIRLPAVLLSVVATASLFFLTRELLADNKKHHVATSIALLASFLFAISPWSIYSARISDEINMSLDFFIFSLTFFLYSLNRKLKLWPFLVSIVFLVIAFYAYHGIKFFIPFFAAGVFFLYRKEFFTYWKTSVMGVVLGLVLLLPLATSFSSSSGTTQRLGGVVVLDTNTINRSAQQILLDKNNHDIVGEIFDNRRLQIGLDFVNNYLRNFAPNWLFLQQGNRTFLVPDFGPFYLFELPLLFLGILFWVKDEQFSRRNKLLLLLWILASIIPASLSSESPHLNRPNTVLPGLIIVTAMGLYLVLFWIYRQKNQIVRSGSYLLVALVTLLSFVWFCHSYFVRFPYEQSKMYQYATLDAFAYAKANENDYQKIIVSNGGNLLMSYMYYLFANKYDPAIYQHQGGTRSAFFTDTHLIGKYDFRNPNLYEPTVDGNQKSVNVLYITNPNEISQNIMTNESIHLLRKYSFLNGDEALWVLAGTVQKKK